MHVPLLHPDLFKVGNEVKNILASMKQELGINISNIMGLLEGNVYQFHFIIVYSVVRTQM